MDDEDLGKRLKSLRTSAGLTQVEMSKRLKVSEVTLRRLERGEGLYVRHVVAFSKELGLTLQETLNIEDDPVSPHRLDAIYRRVRAAPEEIQDLACDLLEAALSFGSAKRSRRRKRK